LLEEGKLDPNSLECRGLMTYMKRSGSPGTINFPEENKEPDLVKQPEHKEKKESKRKIDINNDSIRL